MTRRLLACLTALSLLLCATSALLWLRSYGLQELFTRVGGDTEWEVCSLHGRFYAHRRDYPSAGTSSDGRPLHWVAGVPMWRPQQPWRYWRLEVRGRDVTDVSEPTVWKALGLQWMPQPAGGPVGGWSLRGRWSTVVACTALLPAWSASRIALGCAKARRRILANRCPRCGYDVRATPDRCPECGEVPRPEPANAV